VRSDTVAASWLLPDEHTGASRAVDARLRAKSVACLVPALESFE